MGPAAAGHEVAACAYDVTATGREEFVTVYAAVVDERVDPDGHLGVIPPAVATVAATIGPAAVGSTGEPVLTLRGGESGTVRAAAGTVLVAGLSAATARWPTSRCASPRTRRRSPASTCATRPASPGSGSATTSGTTARRTCGCRPRSPTTSPSTSGGPRTAVGAVAVYVDDSPTPVDAAALGTRHTEQLDGIGDTIVYRADPEAELAATGFDEACVGEMYTADDPDDPGPLPVKGCEHPDGIDFPPTDRVIPVVVFARTPDPVTLELTPV